MTTISEFIEEFGTVTKDKQGALWTMGESVPITVTKKSDPAYFLLHDGVTTKPVVHKRGCYICEDPEFARMGLPLCTACPACGGHVAADDTVCDACGLDSRYFWEIERDFEEIEKPIEALGKCFSTGSPDYGQKTPTPKELLAAVAALSKLRAAKRTTTEPCIYCGSDTKITHGVNEGDSPVHLLDCPECGPDVVIVGYDCEKCREATRSPECPDCGSHASIELGKKCRCCLECGWTFENKSQKTLDTNPSS